MSTALGILGLALLTAAATLVTPTAGLTVAGISLLWLAHRLQQAGR